MQNNKSKIALVGLIAVMSSGAFAQGRVTGVSISKTGKSLLVRVQGTSLKDPVALFNGSNTSYSLQFNTAVATKPEIIQVWMNGLETVKVTQSKVPLAAKLNFKFNAGVNATVIQTPGGYEISFESVDLKYARRKAANTLPPVTNELQNLIASNNQFPYTEGGISAQGFAAVRGHDAMSSAIGGPAEIMAVLTQNKAKAAADAKNKPVTIKTQSKPSVTKPTQPNTKGTAAQPFVNPKQQSEVRVNLDFVGTDVVQILKSLARQTNANIVTSPDVSGKLSIKLDRVTVKEALNLVTSLSGLKFAQVGKTYLVTSEAKFLETLKSVQGGREEMTLSRVVPIYSGQGNQIKVAVLKSVSSENSFGRFEVVLPSEKTFVSSTQKVGGTTKDGQKPGTDVNVETRENATDNYVMLIGSPGRLDEIDELVRSIDKQLCSALGVSMPNSVRQVIETYFVHGGRASDLVKALAGEGKTAIGNVELFSTPENSIARQSIVVKGREDEVANVVRALSQLDSDEGAVSTEFKVVDLMYADPRSLRELVVANVPGVSCVIAPNSVMNSQTFQKDDIRNQSEQRGTDQPAPQGGGTAAASGNQALATQNQQGAGGAGQTDSKVTKDQADSGLTLPFQDFEKIAVPMRLIIRGTREQIRRAQEWIQITDVAPRQVALEMRVMELSREELLKLGIDWNLFTSGAIKTITLNNSQTSPSNKIGASIQGRDIAGDVGASLDSISNGTNLISRPNLLCNDGRESEVFVGDAIRYVESIISSQNGPSVTTGTVRAGVRLAAFPRIGGDGALNLDIRTAITYLKGFKTVPQIGGELPQTSERTSQNTITLKDGETFAIGGLMQQQDVAELSGLPILKDLPIFGQFFRRTTKSKIKTELVIFVTAKVVGSDKSKALPMTADSNIAKGKFTLPGGRG